METIRGTSNKAAPPPLLPLCGGGLDLRTQQNLGGTEIFQNQGGKKKRGERGIFEIFLGWKIAGGETSNRKQNFRMILKMFS